MNKVLVIDIGNSFIKCVCFNNDKIVKPFISFPSDKNVNLLSLKKIKFDLVIISSVVSFLTPIVIKQIKNIKDVKIIDISKLEKKIDIKIKAKKSEIGNDLFADLIAAKKDYKSPSIIFDIGTVNKVLALNKSATFIGCSFYPGIASSSKCLFNQTDKLPEVKKLSFNKNVIGKDTDEAIASGILNSVVYSTNGFINDYKKILGNNASVILTGGGSSLIKNKIKNIKYDPYLTLKGIYYIYKENI